MVAAALGGAEMAARYDAAYAKVSVPLASIAAEARAMLRPFRIGSELLVYLYQPGRASVLREWRCAHRGR